jgi:hypothetical protein
MDTPTLLLALLLFQTRHAVPGDRELGTVSDPDGTTRSYRVSYERLDRTPSWNPEAGPLPLAMDRAVQVARQWLAKQNPTFEGFRPSNFSLMRVSEGGGAQRWVWIIHFDAKLGDRWLGSLGFEAYVLMDGTVVEPRTSKDPPFPGR